MAEEEDTTSIEEAEKEEVEAKRKPGRPKGSSRESTKPTTLLDAANRSYRHFRDLIEFLPPAMQKTYKHMRIPRDKLHRINMVMKQITTGYWAAFPLICGGADCPYSYRCPLLQEDIPPIGMDCPIEQYNLNLSMAKYMDTLDIDPQNKVELDGALNLAMCDIMMMRVRNAMSKRADGYSDLTPVGVDNSGNVVLQRKASVEVQIEERYTKMKEKHLSDLLATREARAKYGIADSEDGSKVTAKLVMEAREAMKKVKPQVLQLPPKTEADIEDG